MQGEKIRGELNKRMNKRLKEFLPNALGLELVIYLISETLSFSVNLVDALGGDTPLDLRGAGIRSYCYYLLAY